MLRSKRQLNYLNVSGNILLFGIRVKNKRAPSQWFANLDDCTFTILNSDKCDVDNQAVQPAVLINFCSFVFWLCFAILETHWPSIFAQFRVSTRPPDIQIRYLWWKSFARVIDQHWKHLLLLIDRVQYISDLVHLLWILALKLFSSCH